jgi:ribosomal protein S18 acetylase RimI-like enzyme
MIIRDYRSSDDEEVRRLALAAYAEFSGQYSNWPAMASALFRMPEIAETSEIILAENEGRIVGALGYVPPGSPKPVYFNENWPVIRMLAVDPKCRRQGIGAALTTECLRRAMRDGALAIALHTSPIMAAALSLYERMGFAWVRDVPPIYGVRYAVYLFRFRSE